ncbi:MAG: GTP cyclohydrolase, FolE2/MptA family [Thaumarchaeota archaeon]|nr:GTP cyclohydrolase, FolE2/MptA family [Candidatus Calditenuaceae archaeon]MDW8186802.1 GTP cyclohydrolase I FolE2 [Nitrososphaerota archaeon]
MRGVEGSGWGLMLPDVQSEKPEFPLRLGRVGISGLLVPSGSLQNGLLVLQDAKIDAFVDLPSNQRGIHSSRTYEAVYQFLTRLNGQVELDSAVLGLAFEVLQRHDYSESAEVVLRARAFDVASSPMTSKPSYRWSKIKVAARVSKRGDSSKFLQVSTLGITACPCAKRVVQAMSGDEYDLTATHMQRTVGRIKLAYRADESVQVNRVLEVLRSSFSSQVVDLLKRVDEAKVVVDAVTNPLFIEDSVRAAVRSLVRVFPNFADEDLLEIEMKSVESIHSYDMVARFSGTVLEAKSLL